MPEQNQCPPGCCTGTEILCTSIPCPINIVVLGLQLQIELPCIRISSPTALTPQQVQSVLQVLTNLLTNLGGSLPTA